jgi:RNA polymerase sigma-70 factor (ECF subfamily)
VKSTSTSLLLRLRNPTDQDAWREFERDYRELLLRYFSRRSLRAADAEDVLQALMLDLARHLPNFTLDRERGRFRDYLFRCASNALTRWRERERRSEQRLDSTLASKLGDDAQHAADAAAWEREWVDHHYRLALRSVRRDFDARSVEIFERCVAGAPVEQLAREFALTSDAIYKLRQRIRARMQELIEQQIRAEDAVDDRAD